MRSTLKASTLKAAISWVALSTALCTPGPLAAQEGPPRIDLPVQTGPLIGQGVADNPDVPVQDRARPDYAAIGAHVRSFFVYPTLDLNELYDSNVFATKNSTKSDFATLVEPNVSINSDWSRHELDFTVGGAFSFYNDYDELNYQDFHANTAGRLDITRNDKISATAGISRHHDDPNDPNSPSGEGLDLVTFLTPEAQLTYRHDFNRLYATIGEALRRNDYSDQNGINEDDRDRNLYRTQTRVGYALSPRLNVFVSGNYDLIRYDTEPDNSDLNQDSQGFSVLAGAGVDITSILFGEASVGYTWRKYDGSAFGSQGGPAANVDLTWNVTPLTSLILNGTSQFQESTITVDGNRASGELQQSVSLNVWHELLRNVLLNGNFGYLRDDFNNVSRTDNTYFAGGAVKYLLNRFLSANVGYRFQSRTSDTSDADYTDHQFLVGITAQL